jgi:hypothetical protein
MLRGQQKKSHLICGDTANLLHMAEWLQLGVIGQVQVIPCAIMQQVFGAAQSSPLYRTTYRKRRKIVPRQAVRGMTLRVMRQ